MRLRTELERIQSMTKKKVAKRNTANRKTAKKPRAKKPALRKLLAMPDFSAMRGVSTFDTDDAAILVRSSCAEVAKALKKLKNLKTLIQKAIGKTVTITGESYLVYQLKGHSWSTINGFSNAGAAKDAKGSPQYDAKALSKSLVTRAMFFGNSDTSC